jgi:hypothetical protein
MHICIMLQLRAFKLQQIKDAEANKSMLYLELAAAFQVTKGHGNAVCLFVCLLRIPFYSLLQFSFQRYCFLNICLQNNSMLVC